MLFYFMLVGLASAQQWIQIFNQRNGCVFTSGTPMDVGTLGDDCFSRFDNGGTGLTQYQDKSGGYTFRLTFQNRVAGLVPSGENVWYQTSDPTTYSGLATGYRAIRMDFVDDGATRNVFVGIQKSVHPHRAVLHYSHSTHPNRWWYAIATAASPWPGANGNWNERDCTLYVLAPKSTLVPTPVPTPSPTPSPTNLNNAVVGWVQIFSQKNGCMFPDNVAKDVGKLGDDCYSKFAGGLEKYRDANGEFTFKMEFNNRSPLTDGVNTWIQTSDPTTHVGLATGFKEVRLDFHTDDTHANVFEGLQKTTKSFVVMHYSSSRHPGRWWYAIGRTDKGTWPGADGNWNEKDNQLYIWDTRANPALNVPAAFTGATAPANCFSQHYANQYCSGYYHGKWGAYGTSETLLQCKNECYNTPGCINFIWSSDPLQTNPCRMSKDCQHHQAPSTHSSWDSYFLNASCPPPGAAAVQSKLSCKDLGKLYKKDAAGLKSACDNQVGCKTVTKKNGKKAKCVSDVVKIKCADMKTEADCIKHVGTCIAKTSGKGKFKSCKNAPGRPGQ